MDPLSTRTSLCIATRALVLCPLPGVELAGRAGGRVRGAVVLLSLVSHDRAPPFPDQSSSPFRKLYDQSGMGKRLPRSSPDIFWDLHSYFWSPPFLPVIESHWLCMESQLKTKQSSPSDRQRTPPASQKTQASTKGHFQMEQ